MNKSILKWTGNKWKIMNKIIEHFPDNYTTYVEPFAGALGSYLNTDIDDGKNIFLYDLNPELILLYKCILKDPNKVMAIANSLKRDKESYYEIRAWDKKPNWYLEEDFVKAARTIYLNKCGFSGLYRINRKGYFNVSYGKAPKELVSQKTLDTFITKLRKAHISRACFEDIMSRDWTNTVFYIDPPYTNVNDHMVGFGGYLGSFEWEDQVMLRNLCIKQHNKGNSVIVSNSYCDANLELYKDFEIHEIIAPRGINKMIKNSKEKTKAKEIIAVLKN